MEGFFELTISTSNVFGKCGFIHASFYPHVGYGARASRPHHKQIERALCALPCVDKTTLTNKAILTRKE